MTAWSVGDGLPLSSEELLRADVAPRVMQRGMLVVEGDGRVDKHRHLLYDWLGVDKSELAVMAELLLRGAQSLGELRGRGCPGDALGLRREQRRTQEAP